MIVLGIDTAAGLCAACVYDAANAGELGRSVRELGKGHAEHLMPVIEEALLQAGLGYGDLGRIGVAVGPGSFTGIRVGVAAARGLALACGVEAVGVSVLEALAAEANRLRPGRAVLAALNGGRGEVHAALYGADSADGADITDGADGSNGAEGANSSEGANGTDGTNGADGAEGADGGLIVAPAAFDAEGASKLAAAHGAVVTGSAAPLIAAAGGGFDIVGTDATADIATYARLAAGKDAAAAPASPLYMRGADARTQTGFAVARR